MRNLKFKHFIKQLTLLMIFLLTVFLFSCEGKAPRGDSGDTGDLGNTGNSGDTGNGTDTGFCGYESQMTTRCIDTGTEQDGWKRKCNDKAKSCLSSDYKDYYDSWTGCSLHIAYRNVHWVDSCEKWINGDTGNTGDSGNTGNSGNTGCAPDCAGKECGDDGCEGSCGSCDNDKSCDEGKCIENCECESGEIKCKDEYTVLSCDNECSFTESSCKTEICGSDYSYYHFCDSKGTTLETMCGCTKGGVGDPCLKDKACNTDLCTGWCSKKCTTWKDCAGDFDDGANMYGFMQTCIENAQGYRYCFPRCVSDSDCEHFGEASCKEYTFDNGVATVTQTLCTF